jgi:hypothetical protein
MRLKPDESMTYAIHCGLILPHETLIAMATPPRNTPRLAPQA